MNPFKKFLDFATDLAVKAKDFFQGKSKVSDKALTYAREIFATSILLSFNLSREPTARPYSGKAWKPLKWEKRRPLVKTGLMMVSAVNAANNAKITPGLLFMKLETPFYAIFQNFGTRRIPARPFWGMNQEDIPRIETLIGRTTFEFLMTSTYGNNSNSN